MYSRAGAGRGRILEPRRLLATLRTRVRREVRPGGGASDIDTTIDFTSGWAPGDQNDVGVQGAFFTFTDARSGGDSLMEPESFADSGSEICARGARVARMARPKHRQLGLALAPETGAGQPSAQGSAAAAPSASIAAGGKLATTPWVPVLLSGGIGLVVGVIATTSFFLLREPAVTPAANVTSPVTTLASPVELPEPRVEAPSEPVHEAPPSVSVDELRPLPTGSRTKPVTEAFASASAAPEAPSELTASRLREEATLLRQAREQLGRGALAEAEQSLLRSRSEFPDSRLQQEREALTIELLVRRGLKVEAAALARAFLEKYPHSPHLARVRRARAEGGGL